MSAIDPPLSTCPVPWIGEKRGYLVDWLTQTWVRAARKTVSLEDAAWLGGPMGPPKGIGAEFFDDYARQEGLTVSRDTRNVGLVPSLQSLTTPDCDLARVTPSIAHFYENTSEYDLELWSEWCGAFKPFGWMIAYTFSRRLQQLNLPLTALDTARGITSEVIELSREGEEPQIGWLRRFRGTNNVIYVGFYSRTVLPNGNPALKVTFPLPNGSAVVVMRPEVGPDGSLRLISEGDGYGDPGFYFLLRKSENAVWVRYLKAMRESIRVYEDAERQLRADHVLRLWGHVFLRMHYRLNPRRGPKNA